VIRIVMAAAALALLLVFTLHRMSVTQPSRAAEDDPLNDTFWPPLPKHDREPMRIIPLDLPPKPPAPIIVDPPPVHPILLARPDAVQRKPADDGICARYNLHKVWTPDGRSWRCRR
jgi:hypothetical protein